MTVTDHYFPNNQFSLKIAHLTVNWHTFQPGLEK